jgi:16S rRNA (guanine966-N2)-methyltransferase
VTRIVAGSAGGRQVHTPRGAATRPTSERVREALFSSLVAELGTLDGVRFLDLFAGSGAVGLEALSRGAAAAVLVERDPRTAELIRRSAAELGLDDATVVTGSVLQHLRTGVPRAFDIAFCDPPYALPASMLTDVVQLLIDRGWLAPGAVVVLERSRHDLPPQWPAGLNERRSRRYGDTVLWYGRRD